MLLFIQVGRNQKIIKMTSKKRNPIITLINNILYLTKHDLRESNLSLANKIIKKAKYEIKSEWDNIKVPKIKDSFEISSILRFGILWIFFLIQKHNSSKVVLEE